jgi:signal transduction histidine kinase
MTADVPAESLPALLDVALALGAERRAEPAMRLILEAARELAGARYAAIGVPDGDGGFALFLTSGIDAATWDRIGSLPRTHGILGALLEDTKPIRVTDITSDPRFGYYPAHHPRLRSFLGVPIVAGGDVVAELFLAEKAGGAQFTSVDEKLIEMLAAHAALAVVNSQRQERARELSIVEERNRIARDLHDSVTQTLFSLTLVAESAATVAGTADARLTAQLGQVRELSRTALEEMRALVETLHDGEAGRDGMDVALHRRIDLLRAVHDVPIDLTVTGQLPQSSPALRREMLKIANEALSNALRHSGAQRIAVMLAASECSLELTVTDDGSGFDLGETNRTSRRLGLTSMRDRGKALGADLRITTAPGAGTTVFLAVPHGR